MVEKNIHKMIGNESKKYTSKLNKISIIYSVYLVLAFIITIALAWMFFYNENKIKEDVYTADNVSINLTYT